MSCFAMALLFLASGQSQPEEDVLLLQRISSAWGDGLWTREVFADVSLYEVMTSCNGHGISKDCWASTFSSFDRNGDGIISSRDLQGNTKQLRPVQRNFTRLEVRTGLALAAQWFPHQATRLIMHSTLITELLMQNDFNDAELDKVPPPPDPLPKLRSTWPTSATPTAGVNLTLVQPECVQGVFKVAVDSVTLMLGILGVTSPSQTFITELIQTNSTIVDGIVSIIHGGSSESIATIAADVWQVFDLLHKEGIFSQILEDTLKNMGWWQASLVIVRVGATVASWYASGTALLGGSEAGLKVFCGDIGEPTIDSVFACGTQQINYLKDLKGQADTKAAYQ